jgi:hypothetical protein
MEIVSAIPKPTERRTSWAIRFYTTVFFGLLLLIPALTDAQDLDPLISV